MIILSDKRFTKSISIAIFKYELKIYTSKSTYSVFMLIGLYGMIGREWEVRLK